MAKNIVQSSSRSCSALCGIAIRRKQPRITLLHLVRKPQFSVDGSMYFRAVLRSPHFIERNFWRPGLSPICVERKVVQSTFPKKEEAFARRRGGLDADGGGGTFHIGCVTSPTKTTILFILIVCCLRQFTHKNKKIDISAFHVAVLNTALY